MDLDMIATCINKSRRTVYRLFENGDLPLVPNSKACAYAKDVKAWIIRKYRGSKNPDGNVTVASNRSVMLHIFYWKDLHEPPNEMMRKKVRKQISNN